MLLKGSKRKTHKRTHKRTFRKRIYKTRKNSLKSRKGGVTTRQNKRKFVSDGEEEYKIPPGANQFMNPTNSYNDRIRYKGMQIPPHTDVVDDKNFGKRINYGNELQPGVKYIIKIKAETLYTNYAPYHDKLFNYVETISLPATSPDDSQDSDNLKPVNCYVFKVVGTNDKLVLADDDSNLVVDGGRFFRMFTQSDQFLRNPQIINPLDSVSSAKALNNLNSVSVKVYKYVPMVPDKDFYNVSMVSRLDKRAENDPNKSLPTLPLNAENYIQNFLVRSSKLDT
jgi:hypothetical protein